MADSAYLNVKIAGGATAQLIGLMNAIYASDKLDLPFKISYYPYSTGTYWPFAITPFLKQGEILKIDMPTKGLVKTNSFEIGKIIQTHPLMNKKISYERIISLARKFKLEPSFNLLRRELTVKASPNRLLNVSNYFRSLSGGFAAINEEHVNKEMHQRFINADISSPFVKDENQKKFTVIHYRLGDKRTVFSHPASFNSDKIIDPVSYKKILDEIGKLGSKDIYVVSDEPKVAQILLASVSIKAKTTVSTGNIWDDLYFMSQASVFIGSNSQVSKLANTCVENNGGLSYMFNHTKNITYSKFKNTKYVNSKFLNEKHEIYAPSFILEEGSHTAYLK